MAQPGAGAGIVRGVNILVIPALTMPNVDEALVERILAAAGGGAEVRVAETPGEALEAAPWADVILGAINPALFRAARRLKWVHATTAGADAYCFPEMVESDVLLSGDKGLV